SNKSLASLADLKGLKMRTYNPATSRIAELAGAQPVTIQASELAQAMATGAVNANITSGATGYDSKAWEQVKYFYDAQAWLPKNIVFVNQKAFGALDKSTQDAVLKAGADAEARGWKLSEEKTKWYLEQLAKNGMTVAPPSPPLAGELKKIGDTMTAEWTKQRSEEHTSELQSRFDLVCRLLLEKKKKQKIIRSSHHLRHLYHRHLLLCCRLLINLLLCRALFLDYLNLPIDQFITSWLMPASFHY